MGKKTNEPNEKRIAELVRQLLVELGEDPRRDGLLKTPERVAKSLAFLTRGYRQTPRGVLNNAVFDAGANHMIVLRNIEVYSLCEHHMLPFYGSCAVGYIAKSKVLGVSKIARIVDCFARRLQIQERLTEQVAEAIQDAAKAEGVGVVFKKTGMVSSPSEERIRFMDAIAQDLSQTISMIDGVVDARVHVVLPENDPFAKNTLPSSAAVAFNPFRSIVRSKME